MPTLFLRSVKNVLTVLYPLTFLFLISTLTTIVFIWVIRTIWKTIAHTGHVNTVSNVTRETTKIITGHKKLWNNGYTCKTMLTIQSWTMPYCMETKQQGLCVESEWPQWIRTYMKFMETNLINFPFVCM